MPAHAAEFETSFAMAAFPENVRWQGVDYDRARLVIRRPPGYAEEDPSARREARGTSRPAPRGAPWSTRPSPGSRRRSRGCSRPRRGNMTVRIMPCLDMQNGRVVKGVQFVDIQDAGDPVACCRAYCEAGADELAMLDITATVEGRATMLDVVRKVAEAATIPFTVGGGIADVASAAAVLEAGADKVSTSSAAFRRPQVIPEMVKELGAGPGHRRHRRGPEPHAALRLRGLHRRRAHGHRRRRRRVGEAGRRLRRPDDPAHEQGDRRRQDGYDLPLIRKIREATQAEVVASGGAGKLEHFYEAVEAGATVLLAASVFHFNVIRIPDLKAYLRGRGIEVAGG